MFHAKQLLISEASMRVAAYEDAFEALSWEDSVLAHMLDEKARPHQVVVEYFLNTVSSSPYKYKKVNDRCYRQIISSTKHKTHAWVDQCSIIEFIHHIIKPETNYSMYSLMTTGDFSMPARISDHVNESNPNRLKELKFVRKSSYRNGIWVWKEFQFYAYDRRDRWHEDAIIAQRRIEKCFPRASELWKEEYMNSFPFTPLTRAKLL